MEKMKIKIANAPIELIEYGKKDKATGSYTGEKGYITQFAATKEDGQLMPVCQSFGDRKTFLEECIANSKELECEVNWNAERKRFEVKLPQAQSPGGGGWKGGAQRTWTPQGYRGKPIPPDKWWAITAECMANAANAIFSINDTIPIEVVIQEARSLVAQFWMSTEKNICSIPGYEGPVAQDAVASPNAPQGPQSPQAAAPPPTEQFDGLEKAIREAIASADSSSVLDSFFSSINSAAGLSAAQKSELHLAVFNRRRELNKVAEKHA